MNFDDYQIMCRGTCLPTAHNIPYLVAGLASEAGEVAGVFKKAIRDDKGAISLSTMHDELGDVLWYVAMLADILNISLANVAEKNIQKLQSRKERNTLQGSGDKR